MNQNSSKIHNFSYSSEKGESRNLTIFFISCWILIGIFSIYIIRKSFTFYNRLDDVMRNSVNLNIEILSNEVTVNELPENIINSNIEILSNEIFLNETVEIPINSNIEVISNELIENVQENIIETTNTL